MAPKFKIGDEVRIVKLWFEGDENDIGKTFVITRQGSDVEGENSWYSATSFGKRWKSSQLELVEKTDEEKAVELLQNKGYIVNPPPVKKTGTVVIYQYNENVFAVNSEDYDGWSEFGKKERPMIAIVPWTEGDGL